MSLSISNGAEIEPTGSALRKFLTDACGDDPGKYATSKATALSELGYVGKPFSVKMNMDLTSPEEFIDVMLGLKADIPTKIIAQSETRFGITLKREDLSNVAGALTVQPQKTIQCVFVIRRDRYSDPIALKGDMVMAPSPTSVKKIGGFLFRSKLLNFVGKMLSDKFTVNLNIMNFDDETLLTPMEWVLVFRMFQAISSDGFSISIEPFGMERLLFENMKALMSIDEDVVSFDVENAKRAARLTEMAGALDDIQMSFSELNQQAEFISAGYTILTDLENLDLLSFEVDNNPNIASLPELIEGFHINYFVCQEDVIAWSAAVRLRRKIQDSIAKFESTSVLLDEILRMKKKQYAAYVEKVRAKAGTGVLMAREL